MYSLGSFLSSGASEVRIRYSWSSRCIKKGIQAKIDAVKSIKDGNDKEAITRAAEELSKEMQKIGEVLNKMAQEEAAKSSGDAKADASSSNDKSASSADKEPVEGEYEEVKKEDK